MSKYSQEEVKVGGFVLISVAALLFILFMVGAFRSTAGTYPVRILYNFISGLEKGAPVRFAGAEVGKVEKVEILTSAEKANIAVTISVRDGVKLRKDSEAYIDTLGLMGEKYVEITPGTEASPVLATDEALVGQDPLAMNTLYKKGMSIADKVDKNLVVMEKLLNNTNDLIGGNKEDIQVTISNMKDISVEMKSLASDIKRNPWKLLRKTKEKKTDEPQVAPLSTPAVAVTSSAAPVKRTRFLGIF